MWGNMMAVTTMGVENALKEKWSGIVKSKGVGGSQLQTLECMDLEPRV